MNLTQSKKQRILMANYNSETIRVYQAYGDSIAKEAIRLGTFGKHFKRTRASWIKPSFLWMMYRSGWGSKPRQENILAIDIKRSGFDTILKNIVLSTFDAEIYGTMEEWKRQLEQKEVRCQWDPDRDIYGNPIGRRAIQLGLQGEMLADYVKKWIVQISDITPFVHTMRESIRTGNFQENLLPVEKEYPVPEEIRTQIGLL